jgi:hypothetical protein
MSCREQIRVLCEADTHPRAQENIRQQITFVFVVTVATIHRTVHAPVVAGTHQLAAARRCHWVLPLLQQQSGWKGQIALHSLVLATLEVMRDRSP